MATVQRSQPSTQRIDTRSTAASKPAQAATLPTDKIAARAYEIWKASGCPDGKDLDHWLQAERELRTGQISRSASR